MVWFSISLNLCSRDAGTVLFVPRGTQGRSFEHDGVAGVVREMTDKGTADKGTGQTRGRFYCLAFSFPGLGHGLGDRLTLLGDGGQGFACLRPCGLHAPKAEKTLPLPGVSRVLRTGPGIL